MRRAFDDRQWERFARRDWGQRSTSRRGVGALVSAAELFELVVIAARARDEHTQIRQYIHRRLVEDEALLPRSEDRDFAGWRRRIARRGSPRGNALIVHPLHQHGHWFWERVAGFLRGLFERTGIPPYGVEPVAFIGDYDATPFGIHTDEVAVVMSMLAGEKRILTWRPEQLTRKQAQRERLGTLPRPRIIEARAGDLVYWPSGFWHLGQSRGFSISLNIALGTAGRTPSNREPRATPSTLAGAAVRDLTSSDRRDPAVAWPLGEPTRRRHALLPALRRRLDQIEAVAADGALERRLLGEQLARVTALGFVPPPPLGEAIRLRRATRLRANAGVPIARGIAGSWLVLAASGHAWSVPAHPALVALPARLAARGGRSVAELLEPFSVAAREPHGELTVSDQLVRELLESLCRAHALVPVE